MPARRHIAVLTCILSMTVLSAQADWSFTESFEDPVINGSVTNIPTGWTAVGTWANMSDAAVAGKTGDQFAKVHGIGDAYAMTTTSSILSSNLTAGFSYTLTCDATWNESRSGSAVMRLIAGSTVIAGTTNAVTVANDFSKRTLSVTFVTPVGHPNIGETLAISLSRTNGWGNSDAYFDNLALYATDLSGDTTPPTPTTMVFIDLPTSSVSNSITMMATNAVDTAGAQYYFTNTVNGNVSGWQDSRIWTDVDLEPGVSYSYMVKARDKSPNLNEGSWSSEQSARCEGDIILYESFEEPSMLPDTAIGFYTYPFPPSGWYGDNSGNQLMRHDAGSSLPTETPFGEQYASSRGGYIETTANGLGGHVLEPNYTYRIAYNTGCAGDRAGEEDGVPGSDKIELYAGTVLVASTNVSLTLDDFSETNSLVFIPDEEHPNLEEPLTVRFSKTSGSWWYFVIYDNIKVYAIPPAPKGTVLVLR